MWFPWHVVYKLISVLVYKYSSCLSGSSLSTGGAECHCCCDPVCSPQIRIPYWPSCPVRLVNWYVCRTQLCHLLQCLLQISGSISVCLLSSGGYPATWAGMAYPDLGGLVRRLFCFLSPMNMWHRTLKISWRFVCWVGISFLLSSFILH